MWRPGWYAKLVPVRDITDEIAQKFGDLLAGWFSRALGKAITGVLDRVIHKFVPARSDRFMEAINRNLGIAVKDKVGNGWWNRRFASSELTNLIGIERISLLKLQRYPDYLH
jgi:hypothetical protein